jgi:hypothetical protein
MQSLSESLAEQSPTEGLTQKSGYGWPGELERSSPGVPADSESGVGPAGLDHHARTAWAALGQLGSVRARRGAHAHARPFKLAAAAL